MAETEEDRELPTSLGLIAVSDIEGWCGSAPPLWCCVVHQPCTSAVPDKLSDTVKLMETLLSDISPVGERGVVRPDDSPAARLFRIA
eukprot:15465368-Alexandrium_andersonii.AAC.1